MCLHYKFRSHMDYKTLMFDGLNISLLELKRRIFELEKIDPISTNVDLQISNAQTKDVYDETTNATIPRNTSVIVARIPSSTNQSRKLPKFSNRLKNGFQIVSTSPQSEIHYKNQNDLTLREKSVKNDSATNGRKLLGTCEKLSDFQSSKKSEEEEKVNQTVTFSATNSRLCVNKDSNKGYAEINGTPPDRYLCKRCRQSGHWIKNCPLLRFRLATGIPKEELIETTPNDPNAMMTKSGKFVLRKMHRDAKLKGKKEKTPFLEDDELTPDLGSKSMPSGYVCSLCDDVLKDALFIVCCGTSFCADCVTEKFLEMKNRQCPNCTTEIDNFDEFLFPNVKLRSAILAFLNNFPLHLDHYGISAISEPNSNTLSRPRTSAVQSEEKEKMKDKSDNPPIKTLNPDLYEFKFNTEKLVNVEIEITEKDITNGDMKKWKLMSGEKNLTPKYSEKSIDCVLKNGTYKRRHQEDQVTKEQNPRKIKIIDYSNNIALISNKY